MRIDKERWNAMRPYEKLHSVTESICILAGIVFIVLELLDRFGLLSLGFDPFSWIAWLNLALLTCNLLARWRKRDEKDELDLKYALFCYIMLGALFAVLVIIALIAKL